MKSVAYVETSVISFYHETRPDLEMAARRKWTRDWWEVALQRHDLVTSPAVVEELRNGDYPSRDDCLALVSSLGSSEEFVGKYTEILARRSA